MQVILFGQVRFPLDPDRELELASAEGREVISPRVDDVHRYEKEVRDNIGRLRALNRDTLNAVNERIAYLQQFQGEGGPLEAAYREALAIRERVERLDVAPQPEETAAGAERPQGEDERAAQDGGNGNQSEGGQ